MVVQVCCRYKSCKKVAKTSVEMAFVQCNNAKCVHSVHQACLVSMRSDFDADSAIETPFCSKRCYNAIKKRQNMINSTTNSARKRVSWHDDGPMHGVSSLSVLPDWMTTSGNYNRYRGGDDQSGATKLSLAGEIALQIAAANISTARSAKDIMAKIANLESSFKDAADWLAHTGQGVTVESDIHRAIYSRCPYYDTLAPIMANRASITPLALNSDPISDDNTYKKRRR